LSTLYTGLNRPCRGTEASRSPALCVLYCTVKSPISKVPLIPPTESARRGGVLTYISLPPARASWRREINWRLKKSSNRGEYRQWQQLRSDKLKGRRD